MNWDRLLGVPLAGEYPLEEILGQSESGAWFQTFSEARNSRAVLETMREEGPEGELQLACWRRVRLLSHPHLQMLYDCGRTSHHGESLLYAVFENPDDSLDAALSQGALTESEKHDVEDAISDALRYLHSKGLVHGAVDARHIIAVGDYVKITTDTVRAGSPEEAEEDLRALRDSLGYRTATPAVSEVLEITEVPAPEPVIEAEPEKDAVEPVKVVPIVSTPAPSAPPPMPAAKAPVLPEPLSRPLRDREPEPEPGRHMGSARAFWPYAAAAVVLVGIVVGITHKQPTESAAAPAPAVQKAPAVAGSEQKPPLAATHNSAPPPSPAVAHRSVEPARVQEWRVIAYTYLRMKDAENKAKTINQKTPGLKAEVYTPKGRNQPPFLVALGGRMTPCRCRGAAAQSDLARLAARYFRPQLQRLNGSRFRRLPASAAFPLVELLPPFASPACRFARRRSWE